MEATQTNVIGTGNVLESAIEHGVKNMAVLPTDKAAYLINVMGISKALMDKVAHRQGKGIGRRSSYDNMLHALWQRYGKSGLSDSAVGGTDDGMEADNRPEYRLTIIPTMYPTRLSKSFRAMSA